MLGVKHQNGKGEVWGQVMPDQAMIIAVQCHVIAASFMCVCNNAAPMMPTVKTVPQTARGFKTPTGKEPLTEAYPGLEPTFLPTAVEEALFKFKGQDPLLRGDSSAGVIRAVPGAAAAMGEVGVYHMVQEEMTFRETPLNAAVSIAPRHRLSRTASSLGPDIQETDWQSFADGPVRPRSSLDRTRSSLADPARSSLDRTRSSLADPATRSLMQRSGSSIAQYDVEVGTLHVIVPPPPLPPPQHSCTHLCTASTCLIRISVYSICVPFITTAVTCVCSTLLNCMTILHAGHALSGL